MPASIYVADDEPLILNALVKRLSQSQHQVQAFKSGDELLAALEKNIPDLILLDVIMPKLQGFDVLARLKGDPETRGIPVIMLSNLSQESDLRRAVDGGAREYLVKSNLGPEQLAARVAAALGGRPPSAA